VDRGRYEWAWPHEVRPGEPSHISRRRKNPARLLWITRNRSRVANMETRSKRLRPTAVSPGEPGRQSRAREL